MPNKTQRSCAKSFIKMWNNLDETKEAINETKLVCDDLNIYFGCLVTKNIKENLTEDCKGLAEISLDIKFETLRLETIAENLNSRTLPCIENSKKFLNEKVQALEGTARNTTENFLTILDELEELTENHSKVLKHYDQKLKQEKEEILKLYEEKCFCEFDGKNK